MCSGEADRPRSALTVGVLSGASVAATAGGASAAGAEVGDWPMDESTGLVMIDNSPSHLDGAIGKAVVLSGDPDNGYLFPGWTGNVDTTGHLAGTVSATAGAVAVRRSTGRARPSYRQPFGLASACRRR